MSKQAENKAARYDLQEALGYILNRTAHLVTARLSDELKLHDVKLSTWRMLAALSQGSPLTMSELADTTGAELSYLSRSVATAEQEGLIERKPSRLDKRTTQLYLTKAGRKLMAKVVPPVRVLEKKVMAGISQADAKVTIRTLRKLRSNVVDDMDTTKAVNLKLTVARRVRQRLKPTS